MKRRDFVTKVGLGALATGALAAPAIKTASAAPKVLKMVTSWPKNFPGLGTGAREFGELLEAVSGGRYKVKLYAGGELVHPLKVHDAVQEGTADMYHSAEYYYKGKSMSLAFFTGVPFGFTASEMDAWLLHGGGQQLWDEASAEFGIKCLPCGQTGSQMGGWFKKEVNSLDDMKGLKMRMPGLGGDVLKEIGASPLTLAGSEIMPALQAGTIDATEWVGPWNDLAFGFYKVTKHYYSPGFHEPGATLSLGINKKFWDSLSKADQQLFEACAYATNYNNFAEYTAKNSASLDTLINKHGVKLHEFSDEIFTAFGNASKDVLSDAGKKDAMSKKVYESFMAFRKDVIGWTRLSDQNYTNKRALVKF